MFNGDRVSVLEDENVLEMEGAGGCAAVWIYLSRHLTTAKMVDFVTYIWPQ